MIENLINDIEQAMLGVLNNEQMSQLRKVLDYTFVISTYLLRTMKSVVEIVS